VHQTPHILIVEDQPTTAEMLSSYFERRGYLTDAIVCPEDALFYPYTDRERAGSHLPLSALMARLEPAGQSFQGIDDLKASLIGLQEASPASGE
jgi:DNA-binding response OmpR family regulator